MQDRTREKKFWDGVSARQSGWIHDASSQEIINNITSSEHWWESLIGKLSGKKILDIGCGDTHFVTYWQLSGNDAAGFDFSPETVSNNNLLHKKLGLPESFYISSSEKILAEDNSIDIVHMRWVIHHIPEDLQDSSMQEIKRVLKNGGKLIVFETNYLYPFRWVVQTPFLKKYNPLRKHAIQKGWLDPEEMALTNEGYINLIERNGFKIAKIEYDFTFFYYPVYLLIPNKFIRKIAKKIDKLIVGIVSNKFSKDIKIIAEK